MGDRIVRSGDSGVFGGGIGVGRVDDMEESEEGVSYVVKVNVLREFGGVKNVRVLG